MHILYRCKIKPGGDEKFFVVGFVISRETLIRSKRSIVVIAVRIVSVHSCKKAQLVGYNLTFYVSGNCPCIGGKRIVDSGRHTHNVLLAMVNKGFYAKGKSRSSISCKSFNHVSRMMPGWYPI